MQATTQDFAAVGREAAPGLTRIMLESRQTLPHAANGNPRAPSDHRAASQRKAITQGVCDPIGILMNVLVCDAVDGVPVADVLAPLRGIEALVELAANQRAASQAERPVASLIRGETKAQYHADAMEYAILERPSCPDVLRRAAVTFDRHIAALRQLRDACSQAAFGGFR
jgi:hypothetical protein